MYFYDRQDAGRKLGSVLTEKYASKDVVVYALPRGGVLTGIEVARILHAPLDLIITRKIGHPYQPEYAIAATAENGHMVGNEKILAEIDKVWLKQEITKQQKEAKRRREKYSGGKKPVSVEGKTAILVDDGIATGLTMKVAIIELRHKKPKEIVIAVPVAPKSVAESIRREVDDFVALDIPNEYEFLGAIGAYYEEFQPVEDDEVTTLMQLYEHELEKGTRKQPIYHASALTDPTLFTFPEFDSMGKELASLPNSTTGKFSLERFPNDELYLKLHSHAMERDCVILGSLAPPDVNLLSFLLLAHTLKKENAYKITAVLPYLAYSRHDKKEPLKSQATAMIGQLLSNAGVNEVVTVDVHSPHVKRLFPIPLVSLSSASIFAAKIKDLHLKDANLVAPDEGAIRRCEAVANELKSQKEVAYMVKRRTADGVKLVEMHGKVSKQAVVIDDILDTGATLIACCKKLVEKGVEKITIMVTHGQFTGEEWKKLWKLHVKDIYITDTIPFEKQNHEHIHILSIIPLIFSELKEEEKGMFTINAAHRYDFYDYDEP